MEKGRKDKGGAECERGAYLVPSAVVPAVVPLQKERKGKRELTVSASRDRDSGLRRSIQPRRYDQKRKGRVGCIYMCVAARARQVLGAIRV